MATWGPFMYNSYITSVERWTAFLLLYVYFFLLIRYSTWGNERNVSLQNEMNNTNLTSSSKFTKLKPTEKLCVSHIFSKMERVKTLYDLCLSNMNSSLLPRATPASSPTWTGQKTASTLSPTQETTRSSTVSLYIYRWCSQSNILTCCTAHRA